jgi:hypothetical protein
MDRSQRRYRRRTLNALVAGMLIVGCVGASAFLLVRWTMWSPSPPIIGRNCGLMTYREGPDPLAVSDPDEAESCLWQAYTTCQTATVVYDEAGTDTSDTHTITVQSTSGGCAVSDVAQSYGPGSGNNGPTTLAYACSGLRQSGSGGLLATDCGDEGDLKLHPRPPEQAGHVCGELFQGTVEIGAGYNGLSVSQIEECFWRAYQTCTPATLLYSAAGQFYFVRTFTIQPSGSACTISDYSRQAGETPNTTILTTIACAGLAQRDGGLLISRCGSDGTIFLPPEKASA